MSEEVKREAVKLEADSQRGECKGKITSIRELRERQLKSSNNSIRETTPLEYSSINYCYYSANTKNTEIFVEKLGGVNVEITSQNCRELIISKPSILVFPTYAIRGKIIPPPVGYFLSNSINRSLIRGVVGTGDTLFNEHFCFAAIKASEKLGVPLVHKVELKGTPTDVSIIQQFILKNNLL